jgi:hypothetical protein
MRGKPVCLRDLTAEEAATVETLARSRTAPVRRVERARIAWRASRGETPPPLRLPAAAPLEPHMGFLLSSVHNQPP